MNFRSIVAFVGAVSSFVPNLLADCWFLPPGGAMRTGLNQISATPRYAEAAAVEGIVWMEDGRVGVGYRGYTTGFPRSGLIRMYSITNGKLVYSTALRPPLDSYSLSRFGTQLASAGDWIAATYVLTNLSGGVAMLKASGSQWELKTVLRADEPEDDDEFGTSLAMAGQWLAIVDEGFPGGIYVFKLDQSDSWQRHQYLSLPGSSGSSLFDPDVHVVLRPGLLAVGQPRRNNSSTTGEVHLWELNNDQWVFKQTLVGSDSALTDRFGAAVALTPGTIAVGASNHDTPFSDAGAVYIFRQNAGGTWVQSGKLLNPTTSELTFGRTVSLSPDETRLGIGTQRGYYLYRPLDQTWELFAKNGGGNFFVDWESPAGDSNNYLYGYTNATPEIAIQRGNHALVKFRDTASLLEYGTHSVTVRHTTNSVSECVFIPTGFQGSTPALQERNDQDADGLSDLEEIYHGTYFDTYNELSTGILAKSGNAGESISVEWLRLPDSGVTAVPEWTTDLMNWSSDGIDIQKVGEEPGTGREIVRVTLPANETGAAFLRLKLQAQP